MVRASMGSKGSAVFEGTCGAQGELFQDYRLELQCAMALQTDYTSSKLPSTGYPPWPSWLYTAGSCPCLACQVAVFA